MFYCKLIGVTFHHQNHYQHNHCQNKFFLPPHLLPWWQSSMLALALPSPPHCLRLFWKNEDYEDGDVAGVDGEGKERHLSVNSIVWASLSLSRFSRRAAVGSDEDDDKMRMIMRLKHLGKLSEKQILLMMKNIHHLAWYWVATWRPVRWLLPEK